MDKNQIITFKIKKLFQDYDMTGTINFVLEILNNPDQVLAEVVCEMKQSIVNDLQNIENTKLRLAAHSEVLENLDVTKLP